jgi:hypothetical protein
MLLTLHRKSFRPSGPVKLSYHMAQFRGVRSFYL